MPISINQILQNRYQILGILGKGGMGVVYQAYDLMLQRTVAVKVLPSQYTADEDFIRRFKREAILSASLSHRNIVTVYDVGEAGGEHFIVMEYLEGATVEQALANGPIPMPQASKIIDQVGAALDHAHSRGIVHRDVKPSNIMLDSQGRAVLMDFGLVRAGEGQGPTRQSMIMGTPDYMAPEQVMGKAIDRRTDIYALGVVIFEMLTGRTPFAHTTPVATAHAHVYDPPPPLRTVNKALPKSTEAVVDKALSKDPTARYQSAGHLARDFAQSIGGTMPVGLTALPSKPSTPPTPVPTTQKPAGKKRNKTAAIPGPQGGTSTTPLPTNKTKIRSYMVAGALLLLGVLAALFLWQRNGSVEQTEATLAPPTAAIASAVTATPPTRVVAAVPDDTPTPSSTPRAVAIATAKPTATPSKQPTRSPTDTDVPTSTLTATPTRTPTTTPTATATPALRPTNTPTSTPPNATATPKASATPNQPARAVVTLDSPAPNAVLTGSTTFAWLWDGSALAPNEAFEIRLWKEGQPDHYGAAEPVRTTSATVDLAGAYAVQLGGSGQYLWTVAIVQTNPYQRIGEEAPPRSVTVEIGGGGGPEATPTPP